MGSASLMIVQEIKKIMNSDIKSWLHSKQMDGVDGGQQVAACWGFLLPLLYIRAASDFQKETYC